jgi:hypothetical protein
VSPDEPFEDEILPFRDRIPEYLTVFAIGFAIALGVGVALGLLTGSGAWTGSGYTMMVFGVVLLLAGGATGGGYTHLGAGAVGAMFGARRVDEEAQEHQDRRSGEVQDPMDRLRKGLRPEKNPRAFWQVVAGAAYIAAGIGIVTLAG